MLIIKQGGIELHKIDSDESFKELSSGTTWDIPSFEYENENILVLIINGKRIGIRVEMALYFDEKNNLIELESVFDKINQDFEVKQKILEVMNTTEFNSIKSAMENNRVDYKKIKDDSITILQDLEEYYDINFIITARGRANFSEPMYKSFLAASKKSPLKISYTIVEHSEISEHAKFCKKNKINYIWIPAYDGELFNKCLAYNVGVFFNNKSTYTLFHDIDCLIQSDFFLKLMDNVKNKSCRATQCFTGRRVLYINESFTPNLMYGKFNVDDLSIEMPEVDLPRLGGKVMIGAPGGSIMVERDLFFEVGGYDAELFLANSPEDEFFWCKIDAIDKMHTSDDPDIEIYHMYHPPTWMNNPFSHDMLAISNKFKNLSIDNKKELIRFKSDIIKEFK